MPPAGHPDMVERPKIRVFCVFLLAVFAAGALQGERIEGAIVIKKKLTRPRVTAEVPMYQRGPAVDLGADRQEDPLAFERARVAIWLEGEFPQFPPSGAVATMEQLNRRFSPETLAIQAGSKVSFPNDDPVFHNVFSLSGTKSFDLGNYPQGDTRIVTFAKPGIVFVNCHLHPNMSATIVVAPNKWNVLADRDGKFELRDVPAGHYSIVAWHKAAGFFRQTVVVEPGQNPHVEFLIPLDENGRALESGKRD